MRMWKLSLTTLTDACRYDVNAQHCQPTLCFTHWFPIEQTDNKEVRLRRTIGLKRDEFSLDRKTITCVSCLDSTLCHKQISMHTTVMRPQQN